MASSTVKKQREGKAKRKSRVINAQTGLYVKRDAQTGRFIVNSNIGEDAFRGVTKEELTKMAPTLKRLAEYDKKGKQKRV